MYILSQILIILSDIFCIISMMSKNKKSLIFFLLLSTILFATHYMCLGGWTGASLGLLELIFLILLYIFEINNKTHLNPYLSVITIILTIILSIITWDGYISLLPMLAMSIYLTSMIFKNVIIVKSGAFIRLILNGVYMLLLKSYFGAGLTLVILIFTIIGIIKDCKRNEIKLEK